jgi:hypothetical protein
MPICVVNFSDNFLRTEHELRRHGLFVSLISTRPVVLANEVVMEVAHSFQLEKGSLKIHHTMPEDFLLLLSERVYASGRPFHGPRFSLQFKRLTYFVHADGTSLSSLVDIKIKGIPTHAWKRSTSKQLLRD